MIEKQYVSYLSQSANNSVPVSHVLFLMSGFQKSVILGCSFRFEHVRNYCTYKSGEFCMYKPSSRILRYSYLTGGCVTDQFGMEESSGVLPARRTTVDSLMDSLSPLQLTQLLDLFLPSLLRVRVHSPDAE